MSERERENVGVVRRMWDAFGREGLLGILAFAAPAAEWRPWSAHGQTFASTAEYRDYIEEMANRGEVVESELYELRAHDDWVIAHGRMRIRSLDGLVDSNMHWIHRFREGLIVETASFPSLEQALEAAGLTAEQATVVGE